MDIQKLNKAKSLNNEIENIDETLEKFNSYLDYRVNITSVSGSSIAIIRDGELKEIIKDLVIGQYSRRLEVLQNEFKEL